MPLGAARFGLSGADLGKLEHIITSTASSSTIDFVDKFSRLGGDVETSDNLCGYFYIYNANDTNKYTFISQHSVFTGTSGGGDFGFEFGSGVYAQAETVNGIRIGQQTTASAFTSGTASLYGIGNS